MEKLTKRVVDAADIREKDYFIWDDELAGLACECSPLANGAISFSIVPPAGLGATLSACMAYGRPRPPDRKRRFSLVVLLTEITHPKSAGSTTRPSQSRICAISISPT